MNSYKSNKLIMYDTTDYNHQYSNLRTNIPIHNYTFGMLIDSRSYSSGTSYSWGFNKGSEKDDEINGIGNTYTTHFRELDSRLGKWWSIDPAIQPNQSPYTLMDNNPIFNTDIFGDKIGIDKNYDKGINRRERVALSVFVNSPEGKSFLADYAEKGQEIMGVKFTENGKYHDKGLDIYYQLVENHDENPGSGATTHQYEFTNNTTRRLTVVTLYKGKGWQTNDQVFNNLETIVHESFIHADEYAKYYKSPEEVVNQNYTEQEKKEAGYNEVHYDHIRVRNDYLKNGLNAKTRYVKDGFPLLKREAGIMRMNLTDNELKAVMFNYRGGLILNPKTGK